MPPVQGAESPKIWSSSCSKRRKSANGFSEYVSLPNMSHLLGSSHWASETLGSYRKLFKGGHLPQLLCLRLRYVEHGPSLQGPEGLARTSQWIPTIGSS